MSRYFVLMIVCLFTSTFSWAQDPKPASESNQRDPVTVSKVGRGIEPATLSGTDFSPVISTNCERKLSGKVELSLLVDSTGKAQNIGFIRPETTDIDRLAVIVAQMDRFTPGHLGADTIVVGGSLELELKGCIVGSVDGTGQKTYRMLLASPPKQKLKPYDSLPSKVVFATESLPPDPRSGAASRKYRVGGSVSAPKPIFTPEAEYSPEARRKKTNGECLISVFVDIFGLPEYPVIVRPLEPSLDQKALEAVSRYRFKPAMRNAIEPVPVMVTVAVNFRLG